MAAKAEAPPVVIGIGQKIGHCRRWTEVFLSSAKRRSTAVQLLLNTTRNAANVMRTGFLR